MTFVIMKAIYIVLFVAFIGASFGDPDPEEDPDVQDVMLISGVMWLAVENYGDRMELNMQDKYEEDSDIEYSKLVKSVESDILENNTIAALDQLLSVYTTEDWECAELDNFLNYVIKTPVMSVLLQYLQNETLIEDEDDFKKELKRIWFEPYEYEDMHGSKTSGFNHVFMGEVNEDDVHGFHNWVRYYNEEDGDNLKYKGWTEETTIDRKMHLVSLSFEWNDAVKPVSTISFGTKPEYELAVFTLCYYKFPEDDCYVAMGDSVANIATVVAEVGDKDYIRTAYFTLVKSGASTILGPGILVSLLFCFLSCGRNHFMSFI